MNLVKRNPVVTAGTVTGLIVALAAIFLPDIEAGTIETAIASLLPVITSVFARSKVSPIDDQRLR